MKNAIAEIITALDGLIERPKKKVNTPYCIKWRGLLVAIGGKTVWRRIGDAKNAFINRWGWQFELIIKQHNGGQMPFYTDRNAMRTEMINELIKQKLLEFVPYEEKQ